MIKDKLENASLYYELSNRLRQGFEWLKQNDLETIEEGKYFIDGENIYANVQSYYTKDDAPFEAHRKYIDIQYMVKGQEKIGVTNYVNCTSDIEYDEDKDIEFLFCNSDFDTLILNQGEFAVFCPQDAHQPALNPNEKKFVKKVVVKIAV